MIKVRTNDQSPGPPLGPPLTAQWSDPQTRKPFKSESNNQDGKQREETDACGRTRAALFPAMIEPPQTTNDRRIQVPKVSKGARQVPVRMMRVTFPPP